MQANSIPPYKDDLRFDHCYNNSLFGDQNIDICIYQQKLSIDFTLDLETVSELLYPTTLESLDVIFPNGVTLPYTSLSRIRSLFHYIPHENDLVVILPSKKQLSIDLFRQILDSEDFKHLKEAQNAKNRDARDVILENLEDNDGIIAVPNLFKGNYSFISPVLSNYLPELEIAAKVKVKDKRNNYERIEGFPLAKKVAEENRLIYPLPNIDTLNDVEFAGEKLSFKRLRAILDSLKRSEDAVVVTGINHNQISELVQSSRIKQEQVIPMSVWSRVYSTVHKDVEKPFTMLEFDNLSTVGHKDNKTEDCNVAAGYNAESEQNPNGAEMNKSIDFGSNSEVESNSSMETPDGNHNDNFSQSSTLNEGETIYQRESDVPSYNQNDETSYSSEPETLLATSVFPKSAEPEDSNQTWVKISTYDPVGNDECCTSSTSSQPNDIPPQRRHHSNSGSSDHDEHDSSGNNSSKPILSPLPIINSEPSNMADDSENTNENTSVTSVNHNEDPTALSDDGDNETAGSSENTDGSIPMASAKRYDEEPTKVSDDGHNETANSSANTDKNVLMTSTNHNEDPTALSDNGGNDIASSSENANENVSITSANHNEDPRTLSNDEGHEIAGSSEHSGESVSRTSAYYQEDPTTLSNDGNHGVAGSPENTAESVLTTSANYQGDPMTVSHDEDHEVAGSLENTAESVSTTSANYPGDPTTVSHDEDHGVAGSSENIDKSVSATSTNDQEEPTTVSHDGDHKNAGSSQNTTVNVSTTYANHNEDPTTLPNEEDHEIISSSRNDSSSNAGNSTPAPQIYEHNSTCLTGSTDNRESWDPSNASGSDSALGEHIVLGVSPFTERQKPEPKKSDTHPCSLYYIKLNDSENEISLTETGLLVLPVAYICNKTRMVQPAMSTQSRAFNQLQSTEFQDPENSGATLFDEDVVGVSRNRFHHQRKIPNVECLVSALSPNPVPSPLHHLYSNKELDWNMETFSKSQPDVPCCNKHKVPHHTSIVHQLNQPAHLQAKNQMEFHFRDSLAPAAHLFDRKSTDHLNDSVLRPSGREGFKTTADNFNSDQSKPDSARGQLKLHGEPVPCRTTENDQQTPSFQDDPFQKGNLNLFSATRSPRLAKTGAEMGMARRWSRTENDSTRFASSDSHPNDHLFHDWNSNKFPVRRSQHPIHNGVRKPQLHSSRHFDYYSGGKYSQNGRNPSDIKYEQKSNDLSMTSTDNDRYENDRNFESLGHVSQFDLSNVKYRLSHQDI